MKPTRSSSRRRFLQQGTAGAALFHIVPARALGLQGEAPPSDAVYIASPGHWHALHTILSCQPLLPGRQGPRRLAPPPSSIRT